MDFGLGFMKFYINLGVMRGMNSMKNTVIGEQFLDFGVYKWGYIEWENNTYSENHSMDGLSIHATEDRKQI